MNDFVQLVVAILSGLATAIPLVVTLVKYVQKTVKERNWGKLLELVMKYMEEAEKRFNDGATKKDFVLSMIESSADTINYDINMEDVANLIDSLCDMSKVVNGAKTSTTK